MASILHDWLHDPTASSAIAIALIAGTWAVAQFRPLARERRRETYEAMTAHYVDLRPVRDAAVPRFPPLLGLAQDELEDACRVTGEQNDARVLLAELHEWRGNDIAFTGAHEVIDSEIKFRAFLWAVRTIRRWRDDGVILVAGDELPSSILRDAETLAHDINAFLFHYETGTYPARQTLGLLHRSLAVVSKVTEPVVWERSLNARWGRRVLRIGLAAQHFNDVTPIHSTSDLTWSPVDGPSRLVHPRARQSVLGISFAVPDSPLTPRLLPGLRLRLRGYYWYLVGLISPAPKVSWASYGGVRLRRHRASENELGGLLQLAYENGRDPADLSWSFSDLKRQQLRRARLERAEHGSLAWLWMPRDQSAARVDDT